MGIFKALSASVQGVSLNQFKELYYCESMPNNVLMVRGTKKGGSRPAGQGKGNIIPDGSVVIVNDGQCAIFVSSGKVMEVCSEIGEHEISNPEAPSVMNGSGVKNVFKEVGRRFTFGGDAPAHDHRIYFVNTKEITAVPIKITGGANYSVLSGNNGPSFDATVSGSGLFSYRIVRPEIAYKKLLGDAAHTFTAEYFNRQISSELSAWMRSAAYKARVNRESELPGRVPEIENEAKLNVHDFFLENFGIEIHSVNITEFHSTEMDRANMLTLSMDKRLAGSAAPQINKSGNWKCSCGQVNTANFCIECGSPRS